MAPAMGRLEWAMLLMLALFWGGSFFFNGVALRELPTFTLVWLRVSVAAVALHVVLKLLGQTISGQGRVWAAFFGMGLLNNVLPFLLIVWGQHRIPSGLASILNTTTPLFTVLVAHLLTPDEKLTPFKAIGVVIGFSGSVVLIGPDVLGALGSGAVAQIACLAAALSYGFAGIFGRRFRRMGVSPLATATGQVTASTVMLLPIVLAVDHPWTLTMPHAATIGAVIGIGILSTAVGYVLYFRILATSGATNLLLVTFLNPVSAILLGALVLGEVLEPRQFAGMALIGSGLAFIDGRLPRAIGLGLSGQTMAVTAGFRPRNGRSAGPR
jgi:drug/metabolite transporter (DMT)-like permease